LRIQNIGLYLLKKSTKKTEIMTATTATGTYKVKKLGGCFFPLFEFNDYEVLFLGNSYRTEKGALKKLKSYCDSSNIELK
jgi:hypothetical protein